MSCRAAPHPSERPEEILEPDGESAGRTRGTPGERLTFNSCLLCLRRPDVHRLRVGVDDVVERNTFLGSTWCAVASNTVRCAIKSPYPRQLPCVPVSNPR